MEKKLFFTVKKVDDDLIDLFFDNPDDTKLAYKAIRNYLGEEINGVSLIARPVFAIILERAQGAWNMWATRMMSFVNDEPYESEGRYYLKVIDEYLVPCNSEYLPAVLEAGADLA